MDSFRFAPELLIIRNKVIERLTDEGFNWLSHYGSVDAMHDDYGIEVCGINHQSDAGAIRHILISMFPSWKTCWMFLKDYGREPGWKVNVFRDEPRPLESWDIGL